MIQQEVKTNDAGRGGKTAKASKEERTDRMQCTNGDGGSGSRDSPQAWGVGWVGQTQAAGSIRGGNKHKCPSDGFCFLSETRRNGAGRRRRDGRSAAREKRSQEGWPVCAQGAPGSRGHNVTRAASASGKGGWVCSLFFPATFSCSV